VKTKMKGTSAALPHVLFGDRVSHPARKSLYIYTCVCVCVCVCVYIYIYIYIYIYVYKRRVRVGLRVTLNRTLETVTVNWKTAGEPENIFFKFVFAYI